MICEHHANTKNIPKHPINTRKSCEHAFGVRKIPKFHLLKKIPTFNLTFLQSFFLLGVKLHFGVRKWCSQGVLFCNIRNTNKPEDPGTWIGMIITFSNFFSSIAFLIHYHPTTFFTPTFTGEYTHFL